MLWRKTYISTARCDDIGRDLTEILKSSRNHNAKDGLTGVLLVSGGSFYQTLEGDRDQVDETFARISRDRRHNGIIALLAEAGDGRAFADWSMAYRDLPQGEEIANRITSIATGETPAHRTNTAAAELDLLISSFLTV